MIYTLRVDVGTTLALNKHCARVLLYALCDLYAARGCRRTPCVIYTLRVGVGARLA